MDAGWDVREEHYNPKGATGFGIRTIVRLLTEEVLEKHDTQFDL